MKASKQFLPVLFGLIIAAIGCSPADITSGTYNGNINSYGYPTGSGSGNCIITQQGPNTVSVTITSAGNPDVSISDVNLTKIDLPGAVYISFSGSNSLVSLDGAYEEVNGVNLLHVDIDSVGTGYAYINFSGSK